VVGRKRSWREKWRSFGREQWAMNTGCAVLCNNAIMLNDK
jgi:hypothetical protein